LDDFKFQSLLGKMEEFNQNKDLRTLDFYQEIKNDPLYKEFFKKDINNVLHPTFKEFLSKSNDMLLPLAINNVQAHIDRRTNEEG